MTAPLVEVLMSTYNGQSYVEQQVRSILDQTHANLRLVVRDDGSSDGTADRVERVSDPRVRMLRGPNLGLPAAYFHLLDHSGDDADFIALSDQDDVWMPDKLQRAVTALAAADRPALYCGRVLVTDEQLRPLHPHQAAGRGPSFANALVQNIALGCATVINRQARDLLRGRWPASCVMHDAWMYLVLAGCGTVLYDDHLVVQYRQHGHNSVGVGRSPLTRLRGRIQRQLSPGGPGKHSRQDRELLRLFGDELKPQPRRELEQFLAAQGSLSGRLRYAVRGAAHRQSRPSDLVLKALLVAGRV